MQAKKEMHLLECNAIFVEYPNIHAQVEKCHETYAVLIAARQQLASNVKRMAMMPMKAFSLRMKQVTQQNIVNIKKCASGTKKLSSLAAGLRKKYERLVQKQVTLLRMTPEAKLAGKLEDLSRNVHIIEDQVQSLERKLSSATRATERLILAAFDEVQEVEEELMLLASQVHIQYALLQQEFSMKEIEISKEICTIFSKRKTKEDLLAYCLKYGNGENGPEYKRVPSIDVDSTSRIFLSNCSLFSDNIDPQSILGSISRKLPLSEDENSPLPIIQSISFEQ
ncbi:hypothetical protein MDAP_000229 [Mitosporidium daphniae]